MRRNINSIYYFLTCVNLNANAESTAQIHVTAAGQCLVTDRHVVQVLNPIGQKQCVRKCLQNRQCQSVNYKRKQLLCEIIIAKYGDQDVSLVTNADCDYIEMESQEKDLGGLCSSSSCEGECVLLRSGETFCNKRLHYVCPNSYIWRKEHKLCFSVYHIALSWQGAVDFCHSLGNRTRLAVLDTGEKIATVAENSDTNYYYWLGASYNLPGTPSYGKDAFYWNSGELVDPSLISYLDFGDCLEMDNFEHPAMIGSYTCSDSTPNHIICEFVL